jgi:RNA recognition motif-containing protein
MKLYVGNLPWSTGEAELEEMFSGIGTVSSANVITDRDTGRSRGFGFVEMSDDDAKRAIEELNGNEVDGRNIRVNEAEEKRRDSRGGGGGGGGDRGGDRGNRRW